MIPYNSAMPSSRPTIAYASRAMIQPTHISLRNGALMAIFGLLIAGLVGLSVVQMLAM